MKLLVRNIAIASTEEKILSLFSEFGTVQYCTLVLDKETGKSKGFGFVEMPKPGEAKLAAKKLNGYKLAGNILRVKKADHKEETSTASVTVSEPKKTSVQFKQAPRATSSEKTSSEKTSSNDVIDNNENAAHLYGKIKESDDY
ncbi:RNP-1 like RNA-binding protein [Psychromonas sp. CNPT3]|uniref:RNA recognition motif domain-containing protein n=1 Tax=Psychromonas sp. CNPT3 TaxID=314282 RepID=UPI00006E5659|nr:RNA-binding protein [Psychromonas sp. CNPT3]AGH81772.1 RNP-1 like RNA-binding protein [Psychromonas sp. CNPT3]